MKNIFYYFLFVLFIFHGEVTAQSILPSTSSIISSNDFALGFGGPISNAINNLPLSNYHFFNPSYHNPAMVGIEDKKQLNADWNRQFENYYFISYEQPVKSINSAFGIFVSSTSEYNTSIRNYGLTYNYGFKVNDNAKLKFGFQFSQTHFSLNEYFIGGNSPKKKWHSASSLDIGTAFQVKQLRIGVSIQNLFPVEINPDDYNFQYYGNVTNGRRQVNISAANTFKLSEDWDLSLAMLLRFYDNNNEYENPFRINDFSSYFSYRKKYFFGTTLRIDSDEDYLIGFLGIKIKEKMNLQFSFNAKKNYWEDRRFFETLVQYQF